MTAALDNLTKDRIQKLLAAVGSRNSDEQKDQNAQAINWKQSRYFNKQQLSNIKDFADAAANSIAAKFSELFRSQFNVTLEAITQHYGSELIAQREKPESESYCLAFGTDIDHTFAVMQIPMATAFDWTTQLLGGDATETYTNKPLSALEESLLYDIAASFITAAGSVNKNLPCKPAKTIAKNFLPPDTKPTDELCAFTFTFQKQNLQNTNNVTLLIPCGKLDTIAGKTASADIKTSQNDVSKAIIEHIQPIMVSGTVLLDTTMFSFGDLMNLSPGDILVLDKTIDSDATLYVQGQKMFCGRLARSDDNKALVITDLADAKMKNSNPFNQ